MKGLYGSILVVLVASIMAARVGAAGEGSAPAALLFPVLSRAPDIMVTVRTTHYWPPNGGENCLVFMDGWCVSPTASGIPWEAVIGLAAACPMEWPIGSVVVLDDSRAWVCLDRGDMSCDEDTGVCTVDLLTPDAGMDGVHRAEVYFPFAVYRGPYGHDEGK